LDGTLTVTDENATEVVKIGKDGIWIDGEDGHVEIGENGIIVEDEDNTNLSGFWGRLLGGFVRMVVKASISHVGESPEKIVKYFVNEKIDDNNFINIDWGCGEEVRDFHETFVPQKGDKLEVSNLNGNVEITSWNQKEVDVTAKIKSTNGKDELEKVEIKIRQDDNWQIRTEFPEKNAKVSVSYQIRVPEGMKLVSIDTSNGSIDLQKVKGEMTVRTCNANVEIENLDGAADVFTSNGSISVNRVNGKLNLTTSNGSIYVENAPNLNNCITSNGKISASIAEVHNDMLFSTSNARIELEIDPKIDADLSAQTSNANIDLRDIEVVTQSLSNNQFSGYIGKGGQKINVVTSNDKIVIQKKN